MNSEDEELVNFYNDRAAAHRRLYTPRETLWEKFHWSGWAVSLLLVVITVLYRTYGQETTLDAVVTSAGNILLESLTYILPARLIFAIDRWVSPTQPMNGSNTHAAKSDAMRRIIGLDRPGGMMASMLKARSRALSATGNVFGMKAQSDRPPGLGNIDNSCYQNSILQGLSSLDSLPEFLSTCLQNLDSEQSDKSVAQTLKTLIADLNDLTNNGQTLWTPRVLKSMSSWTQQDAQEYYSKILDDIEKGVTKAVQEARPQRGFEGDVATKADSASSEHSDDSGYQSAPDGRLSDMNLIRNPLEGLLGQRVACIRCGHSDGISMIPFNCLTLSLGLDKHQHDLYERLDSYTKVEAIEGVECPKCTLLKTQALLKSLLEKMEDKGIPEAQLAEQKQRLESVELALEEDDFDEKTVHGTCKVSTKAKVTTTKTKQIVIARPPQSLVVHINRSVFDPSTFDMIKNSAPVQFPMTLDLGPWCLGSSGGKTGPVDGEELWPTGSMASMIAGDASRSRISGPIYELRSAVTHYGRHENGHYICYRKYPRSAVNSKASSDAGEESEDGAEATDEPTLAEDAPAAEPREETKSEGATDAKGQAKETEEPAQENGVDGQEVESGVNAEASDKDDSSKDAAAKDDATKDDASEVDASKDDASKDDASKDDASKDDASKDDEAEAEAAQSADGTSSEPTWWRLSDHNVSKTDEETVASLSPGVFMLFYECVDPNMVLDAEDEMHEAESALHRDVHYDVPSADATPELEPDEDTDTVTSAASTAAETDLDARSDGSATETDNTTVGTAETRSLADSDEEDGAAKA